jgi:hypothetical protein
MNQDIQVVKFAGLKKLVSTLICHEYVGKFIGVLFNNIIPSHSLYVDTKEGISDSVKANLFWGIYESAEIRFINQYLLNNLDVIELGSSLGLVSCCIAKNMLFDRRLICVEANPEMLSQIRRNLSLNNIDISKLEEALYVFLKKIIKFKLEKS